MKNILLKTAVLFIALGLYNQLNAQVTIHEIRIDQPSTDNDEYFELRGPTGYALDGLTYLVIGDGSAGSGVIENVTDLTGYQIPQSGYFVAAEGTFSLCNAHLITTLGFENSDNVTHMLVSGFTGAKGDDLDTDNDCVFDVTPWTAIVDWVSLVESPGSGDCYYSPITVGPDGPFVPGHVYMDLSTGDWVIGGFSLGTDDTPCEPNPNDPPPAIPVSNWALILGLVLIGTFIVIRFRRIA